MDILPYLFTGVLLLSAAVMAVIIAWAATRVSQSPSLGLWIMGVLYIYEVLVVVPRPLPLGFNIFPADFVFIVIGSIAALRLLTSRSYATTLALWAWIGISVLSIALAVAGIERYGTTAGVDFRGIFYLLCAILYMASFRVDRLALERAVRHLQWLAGALIVIAMARWLDQLVGVTGIRWGEIVGAHPWRVLSSDSAIFLLIAWLWYYVQWCHGRLRPRGTIWMQILLVIIVLLQHRTVWVCGVFVASALVLFDPKIRRATFGRGLLSLAVVMIGIALFAALGKLDTPLETLGRSFAEATSGKGSTFQWRVQSWVELLERWRSSGIAGWFFGSVYGTSWRRYISDIQVMVDYGPHSFYVHTLLRGGLIGLGMILIGIFGPGVRAVGALSTQTDRASLLFVVSVVLTVATYSITYNPGFSAGIAVGLAVAHAAAFRRPSASRALRRTAVGVS